MQQSRSRELVSSESRSHPHLSAVCLISSNTCCFENSVSRNELNSQYHNVGPSVRDARFQWTNQTVEWSSMYGSIPRSLKNSEPSLVGCSAFARDDDSS